MPADNKLLNFFLDNLRKVFYPEEWIHLDLELSKTELLTLLVVERHGEVIMSQIAEYIKIPLSTSTGLVNRLVRNGYLKRERSESDRRIVAIQLTDQGKSIVLDFQATISHYLEQVESVLTEEDRLVIYNVFLKVVDALNKQHVGEKEEETGGIKNIPID